MRRGKRQAVVRAQVCSGNPRCFSEWALKLACGNTIYRRREVWNYGKGGKRYPAPKYIYCTCRKCMGVKHASQP